MTEYFSDASSQSQHLKTEDPSENLEEDVKVCDKWTVSRSFCLFILGKQIQTKENALKNTIFTNGAEIHNLYQQFLNQYYFPFYKTVRFYTT